MKYYSNHTYTPPFFTEKQVNTCIKTCRLTIPTVLFYVLLTRAPALYIPDLNIRISTLAMHCMIIGMHTVSIHFGATTYCRDWLYEIASCLLATEIVLFLYFMQHQTGVAILILAMLASGLVLILTYGQHLLRYHYNRSYIPQVLMDDIIAAGHNESKSRSVLAVAIRRYLTIVTSVLFIIPSLTVVWGYGLNCTVPTSAEPFSRNIVQLASNEDLSSLQYLKENEWCTLDDQQKLHVLQIIADIEAARMCIEPVTVIDKHMTDNSRGSYRCADRKIYIDLRQHAEYSPDVYVNTVLHECRHAYQCDSVASLNWNNPDVLNGIYFAQARLWRYEQNNYIRAENDPVTYYNQSIEKDARYYAQDTIDLYFSLIESTPQPEIYTTPASFGYSAD